MALTVSRNLIEILIKATDEASKDLAKVGDNTERLEKRVLAASAAMAAAGLALLTATTAAAIAGGRYADNLDNISKRTQTSVGTIAVLGAELRRQGDDFNNAEQAIRAYDRATIDALSGQQSSVALFRRLGISVEELTGPGGEIRTFEEMLPRLARGFAGMTDEALRTDTAMGLLGRSGTSLVPILSRGEQGLIDARRSAEDLGLVLGGDAQEAAARFGRRIGEIPIAALGVKNALASALDPTLGETVTAFVNATAAAARFTREHPDLVRALVTTTGIIAGSGGLVAAVILLQRRYAALVGTLQTLGILRALGGAFTDLQGRVRLAGGQFASAGAAWTANALALARLAGILGTVYGLILAQVRAYQASQGVIRADEAAIESHKDTLKSETASIEDQIRALNELREAKARQAGRETFQSLPFVEVSERVQIAERSRQQALVDFDKQNESLIKELSERQRAKLIERQFADKPDVTLTIPAPRVETEPIDPRDFEAQIARQQLLVDEARTRTREAERAPGLVSRDEGLRTTARQTLLDATRELQTEEQRLFDLRRQSEAAAASTIEQADAARAALVALDREAGRLTIAEALEAQRAAHARANEELDHARAAFAETTPGTIAHARATEELTAAISSEASARREVSDTETVLEQRRDREIGQLRTLERALADIGNAEAELAIVRKTPTAEGAEEAIRRRRLDSLRREREEAIALANVDAGPVPAERFAAAAAASQAYSDALLQARSSSEQMKDETAASTIAVDTLSGALSGLLHGLVDDSADLGQIMKHVLLGIIEDLIRVQVEAAAAEQKIESMKAAQSAGAVAGGFLGPIGSFLSFLPGLQGGGQVINGLRGVDSVGVRLGREEAVFDHTITAELEAFLAREKRGGRDRALSATGPQIGELHVNVNAGLGAVSSGDAHRINRTIFEGTEDYIRTGIAMPTLA